MRVTHSMLFRSALSELADLRARMADTQERASTGRQINRPSDDPAGAARIQLLESALAALSNFERTISGTRARVAAAETSVANASATLIRARELAISGANGTLDASTRAQLAAEVEGLHASLVSEGNARFAQGHVFAGFASSTAPFAVAGSFGTPPPASPVVSFAGDSNEIQVDIEDGVRVEASFDGRRIFMGDADGDGFPDAGREDSFQVLADLRDALMLDDQVAIAAVLPRIDAALDQFQSERTRIGAVESRLQAAEQRISSRTVELETHLSNVRDADLAEIVTTLTREETALTASLQVMSRLMPPTLMDFLG
jgi:flagellar hook-associated protein 3 FlgL